MQNWTLEADRPNKPGWITYGPSGATIDFDLSFGASPRLIMLFEATRVGVTPTSSGEPVRKQEGCAVIPSAWDARRQRAGHASAAAQPRRRDGHRGRPQRFPGRTLLAAHPACRVRSANPPTNQVQDPAREHLLIPASISASVGFRQHIGFKAPRHSCNVSKKFTLPDDPLLK